MTARKNTKARKTLEPLNITLPTKWSELTAAQVSRVAYYLSLGLTETEYLVRLGTELADLKPRGSRVTAQGDIVYQYYHRDRGNVILTAEHVAAITQVLKWTMEAPAPMAAPVLEGYKTPDSALYGITLEQFLTADCAYAAYIRLKDPEPLRVLVASLYVRHVFDPEKLRSEAARMKFLPSWNLQAVFLWFIGAKQLLADKFPYVFSGDGSNGATVPGDELLLGLLSSLNDGRIVDNDKLKQTDIYEVFFELNLKIKTSKTKK